MAIMAMTPNASVMGLPPRLWEAPRMGHRYGMGNGYGPGMHHGGYGSGHGYGHGGRGGCWR